MCSEKTARLQHGSTPAVASVLLAEDDAASSRFLGDGLRQMGAQVHACSHGLQALKVARAEHFDLLLLDCRMPGAGALEILAALRSNPDAASYASIAVASSAEDESEQHRLALLAAGFSDILRKPCTLAQLQRTLALVPRVGHATCVLDDDTGLRTCGDYVTLHALRQLLRKDLATLDGQLAALAHDRAALGERLHRLRAACGFCGADELAAAAEALQRRSLHSDPSNAELTRFRTALQATQHALDD
ncbi:MAG TPA: response regulator [Rhodanobacter sp.]|nr:response regulator [Rhodanobacter sp.]